MFSSSGDHGEPLESLRGRTNSELATTSLLMGLASLVLLSPLYANLDHVLPLGRYGVAGVIGIGALVVGLAAQWSIVRSKRSVKGGYWASIGALCGAIVVCVAATQFGLALHPQWHPKSSSCVSNLHDIRIAFRIFASDCEGSCFPELTPLPGRLVFDNEPPHALYPRYLPDLRCLICPNDHGWPPHEAWSDPNAMIAHSSYYYLGYVVTNDAEVEAFAKGYTERLAQGLRFDDDLKVSKGCGTGGRDFLRRLSDNAEQFIVTGNGEMKKRAKARSEIPVLIERIGNHQPPGGNVIYLDGHTVFVAYPGEWPMTKRTIALLETLENIR